MKTITSVTVFQAAEGMRMSATYSEIDDATGAITADNKRFDRVITSSAAKGACTKLFTYAQELLEPEVTEA